MKHFYWIAIVVFFSCDKQEQKNNYSHCRKITDDSLAAVIKKYVGNTSLNVKERFISVRALYNYTKVEYEIAAGRSSKAYKISPPDYFYTLDDIVVIFWITGGKTLEMKSIGDEIDSMMNEKGIRLENEIMNYDLPLWKLKKCGNT